MKETLIDLSKLQLDAAQPIINLSKIGTNGLFNISRGPYLNDFNFYITYFNIIPNIIEMDSLNCKKAHDWFFNLFQNQITDTYYNKRDSRKFKDLYVADVFYFLEEDLMVNFNNLYQTVNILFRNTEISIVNEIIEGLKQFKIRKSYIIPTISLLVTTGSGIETKLFQIKKPKLNISDNYNDDFMNVHETIIKRLNTKNDKGLVLLHGKPGTGKTSYIRYLISKVKKNVIFLPPNMASAITNPDLISVLVDNPNTIFVIEDAENIVIDREKDGNSPVSALLNISDGLLADCLNIQIICSFNTDISKVDDALMRKGRLIAKYEFKELETAKAQELSTKLGFQTTINSPMTLTSIYNQEEMEYHHQKKFSSIGFKVSA